MIETTNLTKHYGDVKAVRGLDLEVEAGSIHGFVGPNGAGKSTTMQMLVGAVTPTVGDANIGGDPAGSLAARGKIGYAPQDPSFYESMTARSYLRYMCRVSDAGDVGDRVVELLSWLDLADAADQPIEGYSGGMRRRLGLAQALVHDPELLILDEPTAELDPEGRASIIEALENLTDDGKTVFVSSHVLAELEQFIEAVTMIDDGRVVASGSLAEVRERVGERAFLVESTDDPRLRDLLADRDAVEQVTTDGEDALVVATDDPEAFGTELPEVLADANIGLQAMRRDGGLEETFLELVEEGE
jgi:ABC-2 type transport system ATP-binding protein